MSKMELLMAEGKVKYSKSLWNEAILIFNEVLAIEPENVESLFFRGKSFQNIGEHEEAILDFQQIIRQNPYYLSNNMNGYIGCSFCQEGKFQKGIDAFEKAIDIESDTYRKGLLLRLRADAYYMIRNYTLALKDAEKALTLNPQLTEVHLLKAGIYTRLNKLNFAIGEYCYAIQLNPTHSGYYFNRGVLRIKLEMYEDALKDFDQSLECLSKDLSSNSISWHYYNRAYTHQQLFLYDKALDDYSFTIEKNPADAEALNNRGVILNHLGRYEEALADFNHAIHLDAHQLFPQLGHLYTNRGIVYIKLKDIEKGHADLDKAHKEIFRNKNIVTDTYGMVTIGPKPLKIVRSEDGFEMK